MAATPFLLFLIHLESIENVIGKQERIGKGLFYFPRNSSMSSSTLPIPAIPKLSTNTLATFGDKNAGNVGPK